MTLSTGEAAFQSILEQYAKDNCNFSVCELVRIKHFIRTASLCMKMSHFRLSKYSVVNWLGEFHDRQSSTLTFNAQKRANT